MKYQQANPEIVLINKGRIDFKEAWDFQEMLFQEITKIKLENRNKNFHEPTPNYIIVCEHPPVFTLGKSGSEKNLLMPEERLFEIGATFYRINRGGDITYHGPGQLVVYLVLDLENFFTDIHLYLRKLEEAVINTLEIYSIKAGRYKGLTGVWLDSENTNARKICAMGVKCGRWITMHGLALNVNNRLDYFDHIIPCGISDKKVTSMKKELGGEEIDIEKLSERLVNEIVSQFEGTLRTSI